MNEQQAEESVEALLGDLSYVVTQLSPSEWPAVAHELKRHHNPMIEAGLLSPASRIVQTEAHLVVDLLSATNSLSAKTTEALRQRVAKLEASRRPLQVRGLVNPKIERTLQGTGQVNLSTTRVDPVFVAAAAQEPAKGLIGLIGSLRRI